MDVITARRACAAALAAAGLLVLAACDPFDLDKVVESCVSSSMKDSEPFGNAKERADSETQFRQYCTSAAQRSRQQVGR